MENKSNLVRKSSKKVYDGVLFFNVVWVFGSLVFPFSDENKNQIWVYVLPSVLSLCYYYYSLKSRISLKSDTDDEVQPEAVALTQSEIDSTYYLGFMITLMLLGASAYQLTSGNTDAIKNVIGAKFAIGLLVTGLGLYFRLDLQARNPTGDQIPELLDGYARAISTLNDRISETADAVSKTAESISKIINEILADAKITAKQAGAETLVTIASDLTPAVSDLRNVITQINRAFGRFNSGRFSELGEVADRLAKSLLEVAEGAPLVLGEFRSLEESSRRLSQKQVELGEKSEGFVGTLDGVGRKIGATGEAAVRAATEISLLGSASGSASEGVAKLGGATQAASENIAPIVNFGKDFSDSVESISATVKRFESSIDAISFDSLFRSMKMFADQLEKLEGSAQEGSKALTGAVEDAGRKLTSTTQGLGDKARDLNAASSALAAAMLAMGNAIKSAADKARKDAGF